MQFSDFVAASCVDGHISADDILALRRIVWANGVIGNGEIEGIFALNAKITENSQAWRDFFVEAITNWLIEAQHPRGHIDEAQASWLMSRIASEGNCGSPATLELLVHMLERATSAPQNLRDFAHNQAEKYAITADNGVITAAKSQLLRRLIYAPGSDRPAGVARTEAALLFRIKNAALGRDNAPEWQILFVQGVGNFLQGFGGKEPLSRERELELEAFMNDTAKGFGGFFTRMTKGGVQNALKNEALSPSLASQVHEAERITSEEQQWLNTEVQSDDQCDEMELALLKFLAENAD